MSPTGCADCGGGGLLLPRGGRLLCRGCAAPAAGWHDIGAHRVWAGDCREALADLEPRSVDAVVTDPPYGLGKPPPIEDLLRAWLAGDEYQASGGGFMGKAWDACVPGPDIWREVYRVLKPGGHAVVFAGTRTVDLMGLALRLAGFEVRDCLHWLYYSGFPKSLDLSKAIDADLGLERPRTRPVAIPRGTHNGTSELGGGWQSEPWYTAPACEESARWAGWGTALKPSIEPAMIVRRPLEGTYVENLRRWGVGGLNVDGCRYGYGDPAWPGPQDGPGGCGGGSNADANVYGQYSGEGGARPTDGRWPANVYACPKASRTEREQWCEGLPPVTSAEITGREPGSPGLENPRSGRSSAKATRNPHPTVKPIALMRWLCRLVTPPGGLVADPFLGSGTTALAAHLEGLRCVGAELTYPQIPIARLGSLTRQQQLCPTTIAAPPDLRLVQLPDLAPPSLEEQTGEQLSLLEAP